MSLAPSIAVPRASFNPLPLYIGLFCLLWSFAFVAGKIGVTDCPPLILLTARFSLAGILILGVSALRRDAWSLSWRDTFAFAILGIANNALYLGLGYTGLAADRVGRPRRPDRQRQSGVHRRSGRAFSRGVPDLAQGGGAAARHHRRQLYRLASDVSRHR